MKKFIVNILAFSIAAVAALTLTLSIAFGVKEIPVPQNSYITSSTGENVTAVCISDLGGINRLRYAYYTPDEFVLPASEDGLSGEPIDIYNQKDVAVRGTYQFVILNLDPYDSDFKQKSEELKPYLNDDNYWRFTMYIPPCYSACCVYVRSVLIDHAGGIENYDFIEFSEKQDFSELHETETEPFQIDLSFYTRREGIGTELRQRACIVTIHYEAEQGKTAGLTEAPIIGSNKTISKMVTRDRAILTTVALASTYILAVLTFTCILKKSLFALPQVFMALGITCFSLFKLIKVSATRAPYLLDILIPICVGVVVIAAIASLVLAIKSQKTELFLAPPAVLIFGIDYICQNMVTPISAMPVIWLAIFILVVVAGSAFKIFIEQEKRNIYLTDNLHSEVVRQTANLKRIVDERDKLLRYLSHDMKKPIAGAQRFVAEIKKDEKDPEHIKALNVINQKLEGVQDSLIELQRFAKLNFTAEEPVIMDVHEIFMRVLPRIEPDCEAHGIILSYTAPNISVFAKSETLNSVLNNLIFNAIEHADCKQIVVSAVKSKGKCKISVKDDGKGIESERDVFLPYYSEDTDNDNLGLGLYICKQHMLSMGGDLAYVRENDKTVFVITLPLV